MDYDGLSFNSKSSQIMNEHIPTTHDLYSLTNVHKALREITKQTVSSSIETFLIIMKDGLEDDLKILMNWFTHKKCTVYVERKYKDILNLNDTICRINYYSVSPNCDLIITLGGDGTVLYASWMYQRVVPPIIAFHLGSLGFLTVFNFDKHEEIMNKIWSGSGVRVSMRMRLQCRVHKPESIRFSRKKKSTTSKRRSASESISQSLSALSIPENISPPNSSLHYADTTPPSPLQSLRVLAQSLQGNDEFDENTLHVLNEVVIDRGPCPFLTTLEVWGDGVLLTICQADGLVISTPTGSTAYSLSAGGSLCHPDVNAILVTPICAHTLSFRPMILPECMELKIKVPLNARNTAWASFDGKHRIELHKGDYVSIKCSPFSFPTVSSENTTDDWFNSLQRCLKWNERIIQRPHLDQQESPPKERKLQTIPSEEAV